MKLYSLIICITLIIVFTACEQTNEKQFILKGSFSGDNTKYLELSYMDSTNQYKIDTLFIKDQKFEAKGYINRPEMVSLLGNVIINANSINMEDPNLLYFYIEPGTIEITLKEDDFRNANITGSETQTEYEMLTSKTDPIHYELKDLISELYKLEKNKRNGIVDKIAEERITTIRSIWLKKLKDIKALELTFASQHPDSYVSPSLVSRYRHDIYRDSLKMYYDSFGPNIKHTADAEKIKEMYELEIAKVGDKAPSFSTTDNKGNPISLIDFEGKIVLLDFWAGWCVPCLEIHPELKELYKTYHPKGFEIIGVSFDKDEESWHKSIAKENIEWNHVFVGMSNYKKNNSISKKYYIQPIPAYILIDKKGYIIERYLAAGNHQKDMEDLKKDLKRLLDN